MMVRQLALVLVFVVIILSASADRAASDTFGSGANTFTIDFVSIGNPGNPDDTFNVPNGVPQGSVDYTFRMGKYEVSTDMLNKANLEGGLGIFHLGDSSVAEQWRLGPTDPGYWISWYGAATFVNWLNTNTNNAPAYKFDASGNFQLWQPGDPGYDPANLFRNSLTKYVLPDVDEWYKAAYYDGVNDVYYNYPTGSNDLPDGVDFEGDPVFDAVFNDGFEFGLHTYTDVGVASPYGTYGQGGNAWEWEETAKDYVNDSPTEGRVIQGGDFDVSSNIGDPPGTPISSWFMGKWLRSGPADPLTRTGIGLRIASLAALPGDFDADDDVDGADFLDWQLGLGTTHNASDLADWQSGFGAGGSPGTAAGTVPEPSSFLLFAISATMMWPRRSGRSSLRA